MMFYDAVIMHSGQYKNIMTAIGLYLLKALPYSTPTSHTILVHCCHQIMCHDMCYLITPPPPPFPDDRKQDAATTADHIKQIIELLHNRTLLFSDMITLWENNDRCVQQYRCATALYLLSMLEHAYNIIINRVVGAPGYGRQVVDGLNDTQQFFFDVNEKCATDWCSSL